MKQGKETEEECKNKRANTLVRVGCRNNDQKNTTSYEIYGLQDVIYTVSDPGHWEKKSWIAIYTKKYLLPTDHGANDEDTLKKGIRQPSPIIRLSKRISSFNCYGLGFSINMLPSY